jgi:hypothetical protein
MTFTSGWSFWILFYFARAVADRAGDVFGVREDGFEDLVQFACSFAE